MHWLLFCRRVRPPPLHNECPGYGTKQSDSEVSVMLELWGKWSTPSLPLLPGPLWPGVVAPDRVLSMGQIELNCIAWSRAFLTFKLYTYAKLKCLRSTILTFKLNTYAKLNCLKWNCFCMLFEIELFLTLKLYLH